MLINKNKKNQNKLALYHLSVLWTFILWRKFWCIFLRETCIEWKILTTLETPGALATRKYQTHYKIIYVKIVNEKEEKKSPKSADYLYITRKGT